MARSSADRRFFATTRGRILTLLRKDRQTVDDLSMALGLSDNAVRNHLNTLERDELVTHEALRRGLGKPAWVYRLTPDSERVFPKPYATVLNTLLTVMAERLPAKELHAALAEVGQRIARTSPPLSGSIEERLPATIELINGIGGMAELESEGSCSVIQGYDCPLSQAVHNHPDACKVVKSFLETVLEQPVIERCDREAAPRCRFAVPLNGAQAS
jgi:predicted ArsR family transcriptional regulator